MYGAVRSALRVLLLHVRLAARGTCPPARVTTPLRRARRDQRAVFCAGEQAAATVAGGDIIRVIALPLSRARGAQGGGDAVS